MMGLLLVLLVVQVIVFGILGIKVMLYEDEESFFLQSLESPHNHAGFIDQVKLSYSDISSGKVNISDSVKNLRQSASNSIMKHAKSVQHTFSAADRVIAQYLHVTDLIKMFGNHQVSESEIEDSRYLNSQYVIKKAFGTLPNTSFPDLRYRSSEDVQQSLSGIFSSIPPSGFSDKYVNPCWVGKDTNIGSIQRLKLSKKTGDNPANESLHCLPYFFILGQPKCGTTDLYSRLSRHHDIAAPKKKEVRLVVYLITLAGAD